MVDTDSAALLLDTSVSLARLAITYEQLAKLRPCDYTFINASIIYQDHAHLAADVVISYQALLNHLQDGHSQDGYLQDCGLLIDSKTDGVIDRTTNKVYQLTPYRQFINHADSIQAQLASHAIQVMRWRQDNQFCPRCGNAVLIGDTGIDGAEYAAHCPNCHHRNYPKVQPCVIVAITRTHPDDGRLQILLAQHHHHHDGMYGLVAGFMEIGESIEHAIHREVFEEVGLRLHNLRYASSQPWPYPSNLMIGFYADYLSGDITIQESELACAAFFYLDELPKIPNIGTIARQLIDGVQ